MGYCGDLRRGAGRQHFDYAPWPSPPGQAVQAAGLVRLGGIILFGYVGYVDLNVGIDLEVGNYFSLDDNHRQEHGPHDIDQDRGSVKHVEDKRAYLDLRVE
jgi:hypothetical protein